MASAVAAPAVTPIAISGGNNSGEFSLNTIIRPFQELVLVPLSANSSISADSANAAAGIAIKRA